MNDTVSFYTYPQITKSAFILIVIPKSFSDQPIVLALEPFLNCLQRSEDYCSRQNYFHILTTDIRSVQIDAESQMLRVS
jgi:hypothetical protein